MANEPQVTETQTPRKQERGTIAFPYSDLDDAIRIAKGVWAEAGAGTAQLDRVAVVSGHKNEKSGTFRMRLGAARLFGLVESKGMEIILTSLGRQTANASTEKAARAEAFLRVELFKRLYDRYRAQPLPNPKALEREMVGEGVAPKQGALARQTFLASAKEAGYLDTKQDTLLAPPTRREPEGGAEVAGDQREAVRQSGRATFEVSSAPSRYSYNPLIEGLFRMLPPEGPFPSAMQKRWLEAAKVNLALVYGSDEEGKEGG